MKKNLFIIALLNFGLIFSQCTITGPDQLQVGERQTYTATNDDAAECLDCFQWAYLDQKILLESNTQQNDLAVKGAVPGAALLTLEIKTKNGKAKCEKLIEVVVPTSNTISNDNVKCDLAVNSFKEVRAIDKMVVFEPETSETNLKLNWTVTYRNGEIRKSSEIKPKFDYSNDHVIDKVEMEVFLNRCTAKISKSYNANFWYFF